MSTSSLFGRAWEQLAAFSGIEVAAVLLAVAYLLLAIRQNIWCWYCAGASTALYVGIYFDARLYMESALNVFYFAMAVYGWWSWRHGGEDRQSALPVSSWRLQRHIVAVFVVVAVSAGSGYLLQRYTDAAFPYVDSATTFGAVWATWLIARKVLENWWYWLVIDVVSVFIYWSRGLELTALLFVVYVVMIPFGLVSWTRSLRRQQSVPA